jgi:predicted acetyltransferase
MAIDVRPIEVDELAAFVEAMSTGFLDRPETSHVAAELAPLWDLRRAWAAFEDGRVVGTFRTWATELTVPGGARITASAVTNVTVLPTHRRRGILRSMAATEHRAARERGEVAALLYAAEWPIYGRFGYGVACRLGTWTLDSLHARFHAPPTGSVELVAPADARAPMAALFETWRRRQPGEIRRRDYRWDHDLGLRESAWGSRWKGWVAIHRSPDGALDGYVRYHGESRWEQNLPRGVISVDELHALNREAHRSLWQFLAGIDLVSAVKAGFRTVGEPLPWLLVDGRHAQLSDVGDGMWVRLFDLPAALSARHYERDGAIVLEVVDEEIAGGRLRVALDATSGGATARVTTASPDLTVSVAALGAAYLGGTRLRDAVQATGATEHTPGALALADGIFRTADEPWCSTFF